MNQKCKTPCYAVSSWQVSKNWGHARVILHNLPWSLCSGGRFDARLVGARRQNHPCKVFVSRSKVLKFWHLGFSLSPKA